RFDDVSLESARERANTLTSAARRGIDLIANEAEARDEHGRSFTVGELINDYVKRRVAGKLKTADDIESRLRRALASVLTRKAADIRRRDLRMLFDETVDQGYESEAEKRRRDAVLATPRDSILKRSEVGGCECPERACEGLTPSVRGPH